MANIILSRPPAPAVKRHLSLAALDKDLQQVILFLNQANTQIPGPKFDWPVEFQLKLRVFLVTAGIMRTIGWLEGSGPEAVFLVFDYDTKEG